jgi:putative acetyltransferase
MQIRLERLKDTDEIHRVITAAFGRENEAILVDRLRRNTTTLSLVADTIDGIVGHIFFSPVQIVGSCSAGLSILGLAPLAVLPEYQRRGIGSSLIWHSLKECASLGCQVIVVVGHPEYYPRFGFVSAKNKGLRCQYGVTDESFMVLELKDRALADCSGTIEYRSEFEACE